MVTKGVLQCVLKNFLKMFLIQIRLDYADLFITRRSSVQFCQYALCYQWEEVLRLSAQIFAALMDHNPRFFIILSRNCCLTNLDAIKLSENAATSNSILLLKCPWWSSTSWWLKMSVLGSFFKGFHITIWIIWSKSMQGNIACFYLSFSVSTMVVQSPRTPDSRCPDHTT